VGPAVEQRLLVGLREPREMLGSRYGQVGCHSECRTTTDAASEVRARGVTVRRSCHSLAMHTDVLIGAGIGLLAAWLGASISHNWDARRRTFDVVARAEIIARRDLQPPTFLGSNNERTQMILDRADDRVRASEEQLRGLAIERRRDRNDLRTLADALDGTWQAYHRLVWYFALPGGDPLKGVEGAPDPLAYLQKHAALGDQIARLRGRLETRRL
jgi:hypothetical protein